MGFFNKVMNTGVKAKLQGEIVLIDRELKQRKHRFGIELYDQVTAQEKAASSNVLKSNKPMVGSVRARIKDIYDICHTDIQELERKKDSMQQEKLHYEVSRERGTPAITASEKMSSAKNVVGSHAKETQLSAQMALIDRDIKKRKEQFGIDVYEIATSTIHDPSKKKGITGAITKGLTTVSETEKRLQTLIETAARDVDNIQRRKDIRQREIDDLAGESLSLPGRRSSV